MYVVNLQVILVCKTYITTKIVEIGLILALIVGTPHILLIRIVTL